MSREIKFRVWDKTKKVFIQLNLNSLESSLGGIGSDDAFYFIRARHNLSDTPRKIYNADIEDCVFQQFTGLKDNKEVEIYEGDIVELIKHSNFSTTYENLSTNGLEYVYPIGHKFEIKYSRCGFHVFNHFNDDDIKVIGNIFENPELIK